MNFVFTFIIVVVVVVVTDHTTVVARRCNLHSRRLHHKASWKVCTDDVLQDHTLLLYVHKTLNKQTFH